MSAKQDFSFDARKDQTFARFVRRRNNLNERIEDAKKAIDKWFEHQPYASSMAALANLEGLLKSRRDLLAELVNLDDEFVLYLIEVQSHRSTERGESSPDGSQ